MKLTPAMKQFMDVKELYPDAIILFRMGDFYECFFEDAIDVSKILHITLTSRGKGESNAPLAGIPYHALDKYLKRLVEAGRKIAICEQIEDPKQAKGIVKRAVTRVITPGTVVEESILQDKSNNYLASIFCDSGHIGVAFCDISTGEFFTTELNSEKELFAELGKYSPSELVVSVHIPIPIEKYAKQQGIFLTKLHEYQFWLTKAQSRVVEHFKKSIVELGLVDAELSICASGALLAYLHESQKVDLGYIRELRAYFVKDALIMDEQVIRNLELLKTLGGKKEGSLFWLLERTVTSMGSRKLKSLIVRPLVDEFEIKRRYAAIRELLTHADLLSEYADQLGMICDLERLVSRITYGQVNPRDLLALKESLKVIMHIKRMQTPQPLVSFLEFADFTDLIAELDKTLKDECPLVVREGNFIKRGFSAELDSYWELRTNSHSILAEIEKREIERTGITSLKIRYNKIFGYFIELTNRFKDSVPSDYILKQSTVNTLRYVTDELNELEVKILSAQDKINTIEYGFFLTLLENVKVWTVPIQQSAKAIGLFDCLLAFAKVSRERHYVEPQISTGLDFILKDSRHPVIEVLTDFVANDCYMDETLHMMVITGPNMAGKSTYMRQCALIIILAQMGCFVPAKHAKIGIVDKLFARIGSRDDLTSGQSTFMVEMMDVSHILHSATLRSFVILDEVGSGTSTYDGVSIAWAVGIDLARRIRAKTLFSTHYHVLTKLGEQQGVKNFAVAVKEEGSQITFLRKIVEGGTDRSYGVHVAKLAGLPNHVLEMAQKLQKTLEADDKLHEKIVLEKVSSTSQNVVYAKAMQKTLDDLDDYK
jgi:DNA mismatch repair protein MutS